MGQAWRLCTEQKNEVVIAKFISGGRGKRSVGGGWIFRCKQDKQNDFMPPPPICQSPSLVPQHHRVRHAGCEGKTCPPISDAGCMPTYGNQPIHFSPAYEQIAFPPLTLPRGRSSTRFSPTTGGCQHRRVNPLISPGALPRVGFWFSVPLPALWQLKQARLASFPRRR